MFSNYPKFLSRSLKLGNKMRNIPAAASLIGRLKSPIGGACAEFHFSGADFNPTVEDALKTWCKKFQEQEVLEPLESIANILAFSLKTNSITEVYRHRRQILSDDQVKNVNRMCEQRLQRMPVQYIIGEWDFRELTLKLRPPVFIPRPETEILVEIVLEDIKKRNVTEVLELCCGSGAIGLSLLNLVPDLRVLAIDKSKEACSLTKENAKNLQLEQRLDVKQLDINNIKLELNSKYDIIVSNPPYVLKKDMETLQPEILMYEDLNALDGGADGLSVVKQIFALSSAFLKPGGKLFMEVDQTHPEILRTSKLLQEASLELIEVHTDLCKDERFVVLLLKT